MQELSLTITHLYPKLLNLYGDTGNIECLVQRCRWRGIRARVQNVTPNSEVPQSTDIVFAGGGADLGQSVVSKDLQERKIWLKELADSGCAGLFICGTYQLLGNYYQSADGSKLEGISIFDAYTKHFGTDKPRCVGDITVKQTKTLKLQTNHNLVGFENHGGRTYLGEKAQPLGKVIKGYGNNGEDKTEGAIYNNFFGTYLHGPILPKNPHFADYLIKLALEEKYEEKIELERLEDILAWSTH